MPELKSGKFPGIFYEPGEEIWVNPGESGIPFYFDVDEDLTENGAAMEVVASALDDVENLKDKAMAYLKKTVVDEKNEEHEIICSFLDFHKDALQDDILKNALGIDNIDNLSYEIMIDCLKLKRFGSFVDKGLNEQVLIMDLSFNPDYTDELMVIYFNLKKDVLLITHES